MTQRVHHRTRFRIPSLSALILACTAIRLSAQTLQGYVFDATTRRPIPLALIILFTEDGDSVTQTIADASGRFSVHAPGAGSFQLLASALGYAETPAGVFDLGVDGEISLEFRLPPRPLRIDSILVGLDLPTMDHRLVRNGFIRRLQRGIGTFITPHAVEKSTARVTEGLFTGIPGVAVRPGNAFRSFVGDLVVMRGPSGDGCVPSVFVDGRREPYDLAAGRTLSAMVPLSTVQAVEIYRAAAEVPPEYDLTRGPHEELCGVIVFWTRDG